MGSERLPAKTLHCYIDGKRNREVDGQRKNMEAKEINLYNKLRLWYGKEINGIVSSLIIVEKKMEERRWERESFSILTLYYTFERMHTAGLFDCCNAIAYLDVWCCGCVSSTTRSSSCALTTPTSVCSSSSTITCSSSSRRNTARKASSGSSLTSAWTCSSALTSLRRYTDWPLRYH